MAGEEWSGRERRTDNNTLNAITRIQQVMVTHTREEMERYKEIIDGIAATREASEKRHHETFERIENLASSIRDLSAKADMFHDSIKRAFVKDDDGMPDFDGHRTAHISMMNDAKALGSIKNYIKGGVAVGVIVALMGFVGLSVLHEVQYGVSRPAAGTRK